MNKSNKSPRIGSKLTLVALTLLTMGGSAAAQAVDDEAAASDFQAEGGGGCTGGSEVPLALGLGALGCVALARRRVVAPARRA